MEDHRKHDNNSIKKKNSKSLPVAIQIGGSFGVMLFGGALVVATVISATAIIAFKTRQQHRRSTSKDEHTTDANPSNEVTSNNDIEAKNIYTLTLDEDHKFGSYDDEQMVSEDSNEDIMFSIVGEDQENTSIYVDDSVFESGQIEDGNEKLALGCEEQVVMSGPTELRFPSSDEDSCSEIIKNGEILIDNDKDGQVEVVVELEDNMEFKNPRNIITIEDDVAENEEKVFMNATTEVACANEVVQVQFLKEEKPQIDDCEEEDDMIPENCEGDLSNKKCLENPILIEDEQQTQCNKVIGEEEEAVVNGDWVDVVSIEDVNEATLNQMMNEEVPQTQVIEADKVVVREEDLPARQQEKIAMTNIPFVQPIQEEEEVSKVSSDDDDESQDSSSIHTQEGKKSDQTSDHTYNNNGTSIIKQEGGSKSEMWRWSILVLILLLLCVLPLVFQAFKWVNRLKMEEQTFISSYF